MTQLTLQIAELPILNQKESKNINIGELYLLLSKPSLTGAVIANERNAKHFLIQENNVLMEERPVLAIEERDVFRVVSNGGLLRDALSLNQAESVLVFPSRVISSLSLDTDIFDKYANKHIPGKYIIYLECEFVDSWRDNFFLNLCQNIEEVSSYIERFYACLDASEVFQERIKPVLLNNSKSAKQLILSNGKNGYLTVLHILESRYIELANT